MILKEKNCTGKIQIIYKLRGYAFIRRDKGKDVFVFLNELPFNIQEHSNIFFDIYEEEIKSKKRIIAKNIKITS